MKGKERKGKEEQEYRQASIHLILPYYDCYHYSISECTRVYLGVVLPKRKIIIILSLSYHAKPVCKIF